MENSIIVLDIGHAKKVCICVELSVSPYEKAWLELQKHIENHENFSNSLKISLLAAMKDLLSGRKEEENEKVEH